MNQHERLNTMTDTIINALEDIKGKDIVVIDASSQNSIFSRIVIATGDSSRQVRALGRNVEEALKASGHEILGVEGLQNNEWILIDAGEIIVHAMQPNIRDFYDIETLWDIDKHAISDLRVS